jgi:hypothetical protein
MPKTLEQRRHGRCNPSLERDQTMSVFFIIKKNAHGLIPLERPDVAPMVQG